MRILVLTLLLTGLVASQASARTISASAWTGKLIVFTTFKAQDDRHSQHAYSTVAAEGDHMMSGRVKRLLIPHKGGTRHWTLGGVGSLEQLKGSVTSSSVDSNAFRTLSWKCAGKIRNNGGETLQARLEPGYSSGALRLEVDGFSLLPKEDCTPGEGFSSPTELDGWPDDWVFGLPAAPQAQRRLSLQSDWWRFRSGCGLGEEREGSGAPPGVVRSNDGYEECVSGNVVRVHTLLDLKRTCAHVRLTVGGSGGSERCVRR